MTAFSFSSIYIKTANERDLQMSELTKNINDSEKLRAEVKTLSQLGTFSRDKNIKLRAIGIGEVEVSDTGRITVITEDGHTLPDEIVPKNANLFIAEFGGDVPNSKITTVVRIN